MKQMGFNKHKYIGEKGVIKEIQGGYRQLTLVTIYNLGQLCVLFCTGSLRA